MQALAVRLAALLALFGAVPAASSDVPIEIGHTRGEINKAAYFKPGLAPVRQRGRYDVTIVYFMDYQCAACRKYTPDVARAFKDEPNIRVIYRDTPIFGPRSEAAARVAIASQFQGKHEAMHLALMQSPMPLDDQALEAAAKKAGVDWDRLQSDLDQHGKDIDLQIAWNAELAQSAGIAGTPAFIVGDVLANGVLDYKGLRAEIADARGKSRPAPSVAQKDGTTAPASETAKPEPKGADADAKPAPDDIRSARPGTVAFQEAPAREPAEEPSSGKGAPAWLWAGLLIAAAALGAALLRRRRA